ncbi:MAG: hydantoinase B/oxoprolinase family protein [Chelatococcus sp.]|uniref:hydantoinase B/oxoprolinase family protein n=1 Tax=Chelatococcus sp. TaxID=1953771 RepID=UPI0025B9D8C7|nr:hydantoinase B/oxoprolinase family protein [Chelatococcus sp.]MBX3537720.1 hydantoinase B/oxoprolinase family protein [Chelatococcus sp.]
MNYQAGAQPAPSGHAIDLQIQWDRLTSMMDEVDAILLRTAFSTIVSESRDYAIVLLDRHARSIAQSQICVPAFTCSLPSATRSMLKTFPAKTLVDGDILITNDPWLCHGHLPDLYIVMPVFKEGKSIVGYIATAAHISDIGGRLDELNARDLYEEGLRIPPSKLYEAGKPNQQLIRIMEANVRFPRLVLGDVGAIVGAAKIGAERYLSLVDEYGETAMDAVADFILERSATAMRAAIAEIPDGDYEGAAICDGVTSPTNIKLKLSVRGETMHLDYTGTSPQKSDAAVNVVMNVTHAHSLLALKCSLCPDLPNNEGLFGPISTYAPEGSILNAQFPAAVRARSRTSFHTHTAIYDALAKVAPRIVQATSGSFWSLRFLCNDDEGHPFIVHVLPNGGEGASIGIDGHSTTAFPGCSMITPAEIIEANGPVLVCERSLRQDSGGAGEYRGGLGQTIRVTPRGSEPVRITIRPDRTKYPAPGLLMGHDGGIGELLVDDVSIEPNPFSLKPGEIFTLNLPGGGGIGNPLERSSDRVERDLELGLISMDAATSIYGRQRP